MKLKKLFAMGLTCMLALSSSVFTASAAEVTGSASATVAPTAAVTGEADPYSGVGSYMAFFQCQTQTWVYRNPFNDKSSGYGTDIFKSVYNNETKAATSTEIKDTVIDGDGEYTVALKNISLEGSTDWNMVAISTNIPLDSKINITAASLKYDNSTITSDFLQKNDDKDYRFIVLINQYDSAMKDKVNTMVPADGATATITFTVEGFGYAKKVVEEETTDASATVSATPAVTAATDAAATNSTTDDSKDSNNNTILIVGIIVGVVIVVGIILAVVKSKKKK